MPSKNKQKGRTTLSFSSRQRAGVESNAKYLFSDCQSDAKKNGFQQRQKDNTNTEK